MQVTAPHIPDPSSAPSSAPRSHHVLLFSGWQTINIGDIGHTPGTLRFLEQHLPEARITLWLAHTNPAVTAMLQARFPRVAIVRGALDATGRATTSELQQAFDEASFVIQNSGMHYNRFWPSNTTLIDACRARGKRFGLYGQSFDGFSPDQIARFRTPLSAADFIYGRDSASVDYLRLIDVRPGLLAFGPDGCFGVDVRDEPRADAWLRTHGLAQGNFLAVVLRTNTPKLAGGDDPLNPARPTLEQHSEDERRASSLREIITRWIDTTGRPVLLAPEVDKEIEPARRLLLEPLPKHIRAHVVWRDTFWNVDEAASVYARAAALVAMEPHSCIIALAAGVPAIHYYTRKHGVKAGMFADLGLGEWLHEIDETPAETVWHELAKIHAHPLQAAQKVRATMDRVEALSADMVSRVLATNPGTCAKG